MIQCISQTISKSLDHLRLSNMKWTKVLTLFAIVVSQSLADPEAPHVQTSLGEIEGLFVKSHSGKVVAEFLGIPYAQPPIGDLRFKETVPISKLESGFKAQKQPHNCIQAIIEKDENHPEKFIPPTVVGEQSEDCLYLNIYAPHPKPVNASVLVFIHGGGFMSGSIADEQYDGRELAAEEGVVVVTMNYRLSVFGFLYTGTDAPGNAGLRDIRESLQFVKKEIDHFGGNPKKVTLMGEGSGAVAAGLLMLSQSCSCLFQQVFLLNGSPTSYYSSLSKSSSLAVLDVLTQKIGCPHVDKNHHNEKVYECVKGKSTEELSKATTSMIAEMNRFLPMDDGTFLAKGPRVLAKQGSVDPNIRVLIGASHNRASIFNFVYTPLKPKDDSYIGTGDFKNLIHSLLKDKHAYSTNAVLFHYTNATNPDDPESIRENSLHFVNDVAVVCPLVTFAEELAYSGNKVFVLYIDHHVDPSYPAFAGNMKMEDLDFFLGHTHAEGKRYQELENEHGSLRALFGTFIRQEDKGHHHEEEDQDGKHLPRFSLRTRTYLNLQTGAKTGHFLRGSQCSFFKKAYEKVRRQAAFMSAHGCYV